MAVAWPVAADSPTSGRLLVPGDHVQPGDLISISGSQISGHRVSLRLVRGETSVDLGGADVSPDGTFDMTATIPSGFPLGYAEVRATDENANETATIILIGDRAEGPGAGGQPPALDDRAIGLTLAAVGTVLFFVAGMWYVRTRPKGH